VIVAAIPLIALLWLAAVVAAPVLPPLISAVVYAAASVVCHQIPERSFHIGAVQLAVCARCLGIYAGGAIGAIAALAWRSAPGPPLTSTLLRSLLALAALPTAVTVTLETFQVWSTTNQERAFAGLPCGLAVSFVATAFAKLNYNACAPRRRTALSPPSLPIYSAPRDGSSPVSATSGSAGDGKASRS
jgi:uncharacterized membrane protein